MTSASSLSRTWRFSFRTHRKPSPVSISVGFAPRLAGGSLFGISSCRSVHLYYRSLPYSTLEKNQDFSKCPGNSCLAHLIRVMILNIGIYSAIIIPPMITPITAIIKGSIIEVNDSTIAATSSSYL